MASGLKTVSFKNGEIDVLADLRVPDGFDDNGRYAALVIVTPGSSVKEQIGAVYGGKMASRGYVTLTFDPSYQGESGGKPRDLEDPAARVEDVRCAVDFLTTLPFVADDRIGVLGICAGGGYAVDAAKTEHRIRAVGTVVAVNLGRANREAAGNMAIQSIEAVGKQRTAEARGDAERRDPWIPDTLEQAKSAGLDPDTLEAVDYYRTPRGFNANSTNRLLFRSNALLLGYDAFQLVEDLLTQPIQIIVGGRKGSTHSYEDGQRLWNRLGNKPDLFVIDGAGHYEMYDQPQYVDQAIAKLAEFYSVTLGG